MDKRNCVTFDRDLLFLAKLIEFPGANSVENIDLAAPQRLHGLDRGSEIALGDLFGLRRSRREVLRIGNVADFVSLWHLGEIRTDGETVAGKRTKLSRNDCNLQQRLRPHVGMRQVGMNRENTFDSDAPQQVSPQRAVVRLQGIGRRQ